jgi:amino acid transporter
MLDMVGIGPFLTIPLMIAAMGGPQALLGWVFGALISLSDGLVWAEFGAAMPDSGGSYDYLQQAFGPKSLGKLMGFLFLWQVMLVGPITAASGGVGFADYARYLFPRMSSAQETAVAMGVCIVATILLYRDIRSIGKISMFLWGALVLAVGIIIWGGATHFNAARAFQLPPGAFHLSTQFFLGLGAATLISTYDFSGYFNICLIGGEVEKPQSTIPKAILLSISILALVYLAMSFSIIGVIPWHQAMVSKTVAADFITQLYGWAAGKVMTGLVLVLAFASVFCVLLGYTRVPFAAAAQGQFFSSFARVHPSRGFPSFSVVAMGLLSTACCLLSLDALIKSMIVIQIVTQFASQCIGLMVLRKRRPEIVRPFQMPFYPLPVIVALAGWLFILCCSGWQFILIGIGVTLAGVLVYLWRASHLRDWPFQST